MARFSSAKIFLVINSLFILSVLIISFSDDAFKAEIDNEDLASRNGHQITIIGRVCEEADLDYKSRRLTLCLDGQTTGKVLITSKLYPAYDYGDFLKIKGFIQEPPSFEGFDYGSYLARYDIYSVMYYPKIEEVSGELSFPQVIYGHLIDFKQTLAGIINSNLPEPEAGLATAILLGYRRTVLREDLDIFSRVGLSHMIAISGSHITIMSAMIINFFLALGFGRRFSLKIIFLFLFLYPLITGLSASAVRSSIMGGLAFLAVYHGRASSLINALIFSGSLMLVFNPRLLRYDIGFQLSFLAVLGIIYLYPLGERLSVFILDKIGLKRRPGRIIKTVMDTVNLTLVSQIVILPVALINFHQLSTIAPLANILVLWTFPPLLASLIVALFLTALIPYFGLLWFFPSYLLLKFIFVVANLLSEPSWAAVVVEGFNWRRGFIYYFILFLFVMVLRKIAGREKKIK